jgi:hypothetical protein
MIGSIDLTKVNEGQQRAIEVLQKVNIALKQAAVATFQIIIAANPSSKELHQSFVSLIFSL